MFRQTIRKINSSVALFSRAASYQMPFYLSKSQAPLYQTGIKFCPRENIEEVVTSIGVTDEYYVTNATHNNGRLHPSIRLWDKTNTKENNLINLLPHTPHGIDNIKILSNDQVVYVTSYKAFDENEIHVFDIKKREVIRKIIASDSSYFINARLLNNGNIIALVYHQAGKSCPIPHLEMFDQNNNRIGKIKHLEWEKNGVFETLSDDTLISCLGTKMGWVDRSLKPAALILNEDPLCIAELNPRTIICGYDDSSLKVLSRDGKCLHVLKKEGIQSPIMAIMTLPNGDILCSNYLIYRWEMNTLKCTGLLDFGNEANDLFSLGVDRDGTLIGGMRDGALTIFRPSPQIKKVNDVEPQKDKEIEKPKNFGI